MSSLQGVTRFKRRMTDADDVCMEPWSDSAAEAHPPRNVRIARRPTGPSEGVTALIIECVDRTCTVVGNGVALSCDSIVVAKRAVEEVAPRVVWRETTPGFWVARTG
jgi:hypothetical protein